jgi:hypothetical protein
MQEPESDEKIRGAAGGEGSPTRPVLIYEAADSDFADSAVEALNEAGIAAYRTGGALRYGKSDPRVCIYIRNSADYARANQLIVQRGAVVDPPVNMRSVVLTVGAIVSFALLAAILAGGLK